MEKQLEAGDLGRLIAAIMDLEKTIKSYKSSGINNSNNVNNGSTGLWISVTCVLVLAYANFMQVGTVNDLQRKYDRMQDYLNAIYAQAPHLRPNAKGKSN